jgi:hypothetical protein
MYSQPLNSTISVTPRLRTYFNNGRHTSIKHLTTPFDAALVSVPGEETLVLETRDSTFKSDQFRYGHPVVVYPRTVLTLHDALANITNMDIPVRMVGNPREIQIQKVAAYKTDDLHANARTEQDGAFIV